LDDLNLSAEEIFYESNK